MPTDVPISGALTMEALAASLTANEQLTFQEVKALKADTAQVQNLVTTVDQPNQLGALAICAMGDAVKGTKLFSTKAYISGNTKDIDVSRL